VLGQNAIVRGALAASCVIGLVAAASTFAAQPGRAETAAKNNADECLARPKGAPPRGSHWFYRQDRSTGKRCWFLGPESMRVRRSEPAPRRAAAEPPPPPPRERPLPRPVDASPPETPPAVASTPNAAVAATQFSEFWPLASSTSANVLPGAAGGYTLSGAASGAATARTDTASTGAAHTSDAPAHVAANDGASNNATANLAAVAPGDRTSASSQPAPALGELLIFFAALAAFVAIAFRMTMKLSSALLNRQRRRTHMRPEPTFVRPPATIRPPFDYGTRSVRAPDWMHERAPAMRLESIEGRLRRPLTADDPPLEVDELPPPRRRAVA
jgi:hypothetical protein